MMSIAAGTAVAQDLSVCEGKGYTLNSTADAVGEEPITYEWFENGVPLPESNSASYTIGAGTRAVGEYKYVRVASNAECPDGVPSNTFTVRVLSAPTGLTLTPSAVTICTGTSAALTAAASGAASYSINNSTWQITTAFTVSPTSNTSYTLYVKNAAGCSASLTNAAAVTVLFPGGSGQLATCGCSGSLNNCEGTCRATCSWTDCGLSAVSTVTSEGAMTHPTAATWCPFNKGTGWKLPTTAQLQCLCKYQSTVPGGFEPTHYWAYTNVGGTTTTGYVVNLSTCAVSTAGGSRLVKCVLQ
jgi:hypothetical protein